MNIRLKGFFMTGLCYAASVIASLTGCSSTQIKEYADQSPTLILEDYLNGNLQAYGFFQDRSGTVVKRFNVAMKAVWEGDRGTLEEEFNYSDGSKSRRVWKLRKQPDRGYLGTADDVIGEAKGECAGNACRWRYTLNLPVDGTTYHVQLDDWMYLMGNGVMLNRSTMSKFGLNLGEIVIVFLKGEA